MLRINFEMESADFQKMCSVIDNAIENDYENVAAQTRLHTVKVESQEKAENIQKIMENAKEFLAPFIPLAKTIIEKNNGLVKIPKLSEINEALVNLKKELDDEKKRNAELQEANQALIEQIEELKAGAKTDNQPNDTIAE